ncbi:MAG: NAD(P)H-dependent oxidoreductase [Paludibacter sp.]
MLIFTSFKPLSLGKRKWGIAADYELVDIKDYNLPLLDEPLPASMGQYMSPHTKARAEKIKLLDAFIFVTGEYNHSLPAALKNALNYLYAEWNNKAAGFVRYGSAGGSRAVELLRLIMDELLVADVRNQVLLSLFNDFKTIAFLNRHPCKNAV